jgi:hypothetical protein
VRCTPALRLRDQEIAKRLHARDVLHLLGIDQKTIHLRHVGLRQQADQTGIRRDAIIRQHRDADAVLDGADDRAEIVDRDMRRARVLRVAPDRQQRIQIIEEMRRRRRAECDQTVIVEILERARLAALLQIFGRGVGVEMHGEQPAADEVGLHRLAQPQRDIGLAHAEIEFVVGQQKLQLDFGKEFDEFAEPRREPIGAERERRGHAQIAVRLVPAVDQAAAHRVQLQRDVVHRAEQRLALFGEDQAARMAMKQRRAEILFERADLPADGRLAQTQRFAGMGERARLGRGLKNAQLVPVHCPRGPPDARIRDISGLRRKPIAQHDNFAGVRSAGRRLIRCPEHGGLEAGLSQRRLGDQPAVGLQRRHAAEAGGGDRLAEDVVGDVAGGEHALDAGRGRSRRRLDVAVRLSASSWPRTSSVAGAWPIATNTPVGGDFLERRSRHRAAARR